MTILDATIGVAVLTLNGAAHLPRCLSPLLASPLKPRLLVVDSSSDDNTVAVAQGLGAETLVIPRSSFNHGATRELARRQLGTTIVVMVTQDAYAVDSGALGILVAPLLNGSAAVAYGRQLPHHGADLYETFHRHFNYPEESQHRSVEDLPHYGKQLFFCSNSFAAYHNSALDQIGGFPSVLFGEDTVAVASILRRGYSLAYVADAAVYHSHAYSLRQEFHRHFDIGYARRSQHQLLDCGESDSVRGRAYVKALLSLVWQKKPWCLPYGCLLVTTKWLGYKLGWYGRLFPLSLCRRLSSHRGFWNS